MRRQLRMRSDSRKARKNGNALQFHSVLAIGKIHGAILLITLLSTIQKAFRRPSGGTLHEIHTHLRSRVFSGRARRAASGLEPDRPNAERRLIDFYPVR